MQETLTINVRKTIRALARIELIGSVVKLRQRIAEVRVTMLSESGRKSLKHRTGSNGSVSVSRNYLLGELRQIEETRTIERARYYVRRLRRALSDVKTSPINDLNLHRWKEYRNIQTDSLWILQKRDSSGPHSAWYWGNFVPQIPHQLMLRYTKKGDWVLDPFAGSGTTLIECHRLGRNCLGVELQPSIARKTRNRLKDVFRKDDSGSLALEVGDSTKADFHSLLQRHGTRSVQLAILHPPYHDIIRFSRKRNDLSNAGSTESFTNMFGEVIDNVGKVLDEGRYLAVVIGDKYEEGEWIPLGFLLMAEVLKRGYKLKSIVVKNFEETLGKRNQKELWRYRALAGGFFVFKHEYILIFQKR